MDIQGKDTLCRCWMLGIANKMIDPVFLSHLSIQQCHRDVAIDVAPSGAQGGELHGGGRWEGRRHGGGLWGKLELIAAAEVPHLGCCGSVTASQRQRHVVIVWDVRPQGNL